MTVLVSKKNYPDSAAKLTLDPSKLRDTFSVDREISQPAVYRRNAYVTCQKPPAVGLLETSIVKKMINISI